MVVKSDELRQSAAKRWANYAKAAGLGAFALGVASHADAAIVHGAGTYNGAAPSFPIVINPVSYTGANRFNFDGVGLDDIALGTGAYGTAFARDMGLEGGTLGGMVLTSGPGGYYYTSAFASGELVSGSAQSNVNSGARTLSLGSFSPGYLGFKTSSGYYGWMDVSLSLNPLVVITINDWAYDDTGAGIRAGAIPEPSSLALLAAGSIGLLARRRRKNAA